MLRFLFCIFFLNGILAHAQISIEFIDQQSNDPISNVTLFEGDKFLGESDSLGRFTLGISEVDKRIQYSRVGYKQGLIEDINDCVSCHFKIKMTSIIDIEVLVEAYRNTRQEDYSLLNPQQMMKQNFLGGKPDIIRSLTQLPSVTSGKEGLATYHVRGMGHENNDMYLDGVPILSKSSAFDFYTNVPLQIVANGTFYPGSYPSSYGGKLGSILMLESKSQISSKVLELNASPAVTNFYVQNKLGKTDRWSYLVNINASPLGLATRNGNKKKVLNGESRYYFSGFQWYDGFGKLNFQHEDFKLGLFYLQNLNFSNSGSFNDFNLSTDKYMTFAQVLGLQMQKSISPKLSGKYAIGLSGFSNRFGYHSAFIDQNKVKAHIDNSNDQYNNLILSNRLDLTYQYNDLIEIQSGLQSLINLVGKGIEENVQINTIENITNESLLKTNINQKSHQFNSWLLGTIQKNNWGGEAGLRFEHYQFENYSENNLLPFAKLKFQSGNWKTYLSFSHSRQYEHEIRNFDYLGTFNFFIPSKNGRSSQFSQNWTTGVSHTITKWNTTWNVDLYHKTLENQLHYFQFTGEFDYDDLFGKIYSGGKGYSYGVELGFNTFFKNSAELRLSLSLNNSKRQFDQLNDGDWFNFQYNRGVDFKTFFSSPIGKRWSFSSSFYLRGGHYFTLPIGIVSKDISGGSYDWAIYSEVNTYKLPIYHRLDGTLNYHFSKKRKDNKLYLSVYNVYSYPNVVGYEHRFTETSSGLVLKPRTTFPVIPNIGIILNFK